MEFMQIITNENFEKGSEGALVWKKDEEGMFIVRPSYNIYQNNSSGKNTCNILVGYYYFK